MKFRMPHTLVIVGALVVIVLVLSWVIPSGSYQRVEKDGRKITVPGSYQVVDKHRLGPHWALTAPLKGFEDGAEIIAFLLIIGGAFAIMQESGSIEFAIKRLTASLSSHPTLRILIIPVLMTLFSAAGSSFGMCEETMPFVLIFVPLAISLGYDSIVGIAIPFLGAAAGFAAACTNPFTVGVAQTIAGVPPFSGIGYRLFTWVVGTGVCIAWVMVYAARIRKNPRLSPVYELDRARETHATDDTGAAGSWSLRHVLVLVTLLVTMVVLVVGVLKYEWFILELAALFMAMGLVMGFVSRMGVNQMAATFAAGAKDMVGVTLIIACGRALLIIAREAQVLDTILFYSSQAIAGVPPVIAASLMFFIQAIINFFIHSGTGQAALTMPIMAPLAELVGLTRQTMVYAFQLCEFVNPILPTSAVTMGVLGMAKVPWEVWAKWFLPLLGLLMLLSVLLLVPPVLTHWGPY